MKTREQVIAEIITAYHRHASHHQDMALKFALKSMDDANLFILAQDLGVSLEPIKPAPTTSRPDVFKAIFPTGPKIDFDGINGGK